MELRSRTIQGRKVEEVSLNSVFSHDFARAACSVSLVDPELAQGSGAGRKLMHVGDDHESDRSENACFCLLSPHITAVIQFIFLEEEEISTTNA